MGRSWAEREKIAQRLPGEDRCRDLGMTAVVRVRPKRHGPGLEKDQVEA